MPIVAPIAPDLPHPRCFLWDRPQALTCELQEVLLVLSRVENALCKNVPPLSPDDWGDGFYSFRFLLSSETNFSLMHTPCAPSTRERAQNRYMGEAWIRATASPMRNIEWKVTELCRPLIVSVLEEVCHDFPQ